MEGRKLCFFFLFFTIVDSFLFSTLDRAKVQVLLTTGDQSKKLSQENDLYPLHDNNNLPQININKNQRYQTMEGFGAGLSNSAASVIYHSPKRHEIMRQLFSSTGGIGVSYIRITMGGSDFQAVPPYTYDDMPNGQTDFQMNHFSIQKDREFFIPIIKEALSLNPSLKIVATPWSPPAWMKSTNTLYGGDFHQDWDGKYQQALSLYFVKFIQAYKAEGIDINAITIQNEPRLQTSGYPTMTMSWQIQRDLIKWHMGPLFRQNNINTKILILDHNWDLHEYPENILRDNDATQYVGGVAWHCYAGDKSEPERLHSKFSNIDQYFTECSGYAGSPNFKGNLVWNFDNLFLQQPRVWAKTVLFWNIALDQNHGPRVQVQGCKDCRGVITVYSGSDRYQKEVEYYIIGHLTKVVKTQAVRIDSTDNVNGLRSVAFENPLGTIAVVVLNTQDQSKQFALNFNGVRYSYNLPGKSVASFLYSP
ncbi:uncharacterized protein LOC127718046 [Mytilus californianus]|uniref:uncharacterized protein LOC127718046 n=1 Tax=Mytilus californianus TaxID=6549 RepID=UPI00224618CF|nr:uncharacterized protein LOC127718046 [Mytilus californianus]